MNDAEASSKQSNQHKYARIRMTGMNREQYLQQQQQQSEEEEEA